MKLAHIVILILLCCLSFITLRCEMDEGLDIIPWIEGQIILDSIDRVDEGQTGDVVVVVAPDFPPRTWTDILKTPPLDFRRDVRTDTISYKLPLNHGQYDVVAVLWKPKGEEWSFQNISNILGVYTAPNIFRPEVVNIQRDQKLRPFQIIYQ